MINTIQSENFLTIEISETSGIEDASMLKNEIQNAFDKEFAINIILKNESPLHITSCVAILAAALEANKKNGILTINDEARTLENTFKSLGLQKELNDVIQKLKDRG